MKRINSIFAILFVLFFNQANAQYFKGIHSSNYCPLQNLSNNVAGLVDDSSRWHVNIVSLQLDALKNLDHFESDAPNYIKKLGFSSINNLMSNINSQAYIQGKVLFPSISFKINDKNALAFSINIRANGLYGVSHSNVGKFFSTENATNSQLENEWLSGIVQSWTEYGLSYARKIIDNEKYTLSGGITLKLIQSGGSGYVELNNLSTIIENEMVKKFNVNITYGINKALYTITDDGKVKFNGSKGLGGDISFSYTKKSHTPNQIYKYKLALAINDIGNIRNKSNKNVNQYKVSISDTPYSRFNNIKTFSALVDSIEASVHIQKISSTKFKQDLPIRYNLMFDYCFYKNWFLNTVFTYKQNNYKKLVKNIGKDITSITLTPRYEKVKWGVYLPIAYHSTLGLYTGLSARWKFIFMGSSMNLSNIFEDKASKTEFYFGVDIPIGRFHQL